ncbi:S-adenosyl-l-methionine hydroxide adenosyltransferase family protein [Marinitoga arctica]
MIAFFTDWGNDSHYVGVCKGVMKTINKNAEIIDVLHETKKFDPKVNAYILHRFSKDFPEGTIFLSVIDAGVGSNRKPVIMKAKKRNYYFIAPDNGLLTLVAEEYGIDKLVEISNEKYFFKKQYSTTFHGRDIFSPAAAYLSKGVPLEEFGPELDDINLFRYKKPEIKNESIEGEIIFFDTFGNIQTNIPAELGDTLFKKDDEIIIHLEDRKIKAYYERIFSDVLPGELLIHPESTGFLEIAINQGSAKDVLELESEGAEIILRKENS